MEGDSKPKVEVRKGDVVLFVFAAMLWATWYLVHLSPWVSATAFWGGAITLAAMLGIFVVVVKWALEEELKAIPGLLFGKWRLTWLYVFGVVAGLFLLTTTRSVYVQYKTAKDGGAVTEGEYRVRWWREGKGWTEATLSEKNPSVGRPFFAQFRPRRVTVEVLDPPLFQPYTSEALLPWSRLTLEIPAGLKAREFHVVRVLPGPNLLSELAAPESNPSAVFSLEVTAGGRSYRMEDVRRQAWAMGGNMVQVTWVFGQEDAAARDRALSLMAGQFALPDEGSRKKLLGVWQTVRVMETGELNGGEVLDVTLWIRRSGAAGAEVKQRSQIKVRSDPGVQNEILEDKSPP
jgi:hypothetical protein